jgi:hypothetical protein
VRKGTLLLVVAMLAIAGGCTRTKTLDGPGLDQAIATNLSKELNVQGFTVACPDDVPAEAGGTFQCTATNPDGTQITLQVTQTDDHGTVNYEVAGGA